MQVRYGQPMHVRARRGVTGVVAIVVSVAILTACGGGSEPVDAGAGAPAAPGREGETSPPGAEADGAAETDTAEADTAATQADDAGEPVGDAPSPVEGLTADQLREAVEAPSSAAAVQARRRGPVAEPITVAGRSLWRVTVPGRFQILSSAIVVAVGGHDVGEGVVADDLASLVVVTADPAPLVAGAAVTFRWGAGAPTAAGSLEVVR